MEDSSTYQATLAKGRVEGIAEGEAREARSLLLRVAAKRLGTASAQVEAKLSTMRDVAALEALFDRVLEVESWDELLP